jgi:hypothetical protein
MHIPLRVIVIPVLVPVLVASSCCSIPSNTPKLIGLTNERIENHTVAVTAALQLTIDEAAFAREDIEAVREELMALRAGAELSDENAKVLDVAISELTRVAKDLDFEENVRNMPRNTERVMGEVAASLRLVQEIVGSEVDKRQLIEDMISAFKRTGGESK